MGWVWEFMVVSGRGASVVRVSCSVLQLQAVVRPRSSLASRLISYPANLTYMLLVLVARESKRVFRIASLYSVVVKS